MNDEKDLFDHFLERMKPGVQIDFLILFDCIRFLKNEVKELKKRIEFLEKR